MPEGYSAVHIAWINPLRNEDLSSYARRLSVQIDTTVPFVLFGVSFGGILVSEIIRWVQPEKSVIISSLTTSSLPWYYRAIRYSGLYRIVPTALLKSANPLTCWFFGAKSSDEKKQLKGTLRDTSPHFLKWAIRQILRWKNGRANVGIYHIHGSSDHIIPLHRVKPDVIISGGGHLMVYSHADQVSRYLSSWLTAKEPAE